MPANAIRGIGRWCTELTISLLDLYPGIIAGLSVDPGLPLPRVISQVGADVPILRSESPPADVDRGGVVFHALSPLEALPIDRIWPLWARNPSVGLVTTLYDMIPLLFPDDYFHGALRRLLEVRYELHRQADAVIAISQTTIDDGVRLLGIDASRTFKASGGVSTRFTPSEGGRQAAERDLGAIGVRPGFLLTIGNVDPRKNLALLIEAFAQLSPALRRRHQLVITCSQGDRGYLQRFINQAAELGAEKDLLILPYVTDDIIVRLYQGCEAMVYPSIYEGLGLPLIEALACGAPVLTSDVGPMREIVNQREARFDASAPSSIAGVLRRALTTPTLLRELRAGAATSAGKYTWQSSIQSARDAYVKAVRTL
jgi:glycosyltransferase involved in cell wall biosynthesis